MPIGDHQQHHLCFYCLFGSSSAEQLPLMVDITSTHWIFKSENCAAQGWMDLSRSSGLFLFYCAVPQSRRVCMLMGHHVFDGCFLYTHYAYGQKGVSHDGVSI